MSDSTTELGLQLCVDADDTADYLTIRLRQSLQSVDSLFNQAAGHTHSGPHQGGQIQAAAFAGAFDIANWFRSRSVGSAAPASGVGLEWYYDSANSRGVVQAIDHAGPVYKSLVLCSSDFIVQVGGQNALNINANHDLNLLDTSSTKQASIRIRAGGGIEFVNKAYSAVTLSVDDSGNVTIPGTLSVVAISASGGVTLSGAVTTNAIQINGTATIAAIHVTGNSQLDGGLTVNGTMTAAAINASGAITASNNLLVPSGQIKVGTAFSGGLAGDILLQRPSAPGTGSIALGNASHSLDWDGGKYNLWNGGIQVGDWISAGVGRQDTYQLTLPNKAPTDHTGKGIATGWDSWSAARGKTDIRPLADPLAIVTHPNVHGVAYKHVDAPDGPDMVGFIAEDWHAVLPAVVSLGEDGAPQALDYGRIGAVTFQALKELAEQVADLASRLTALEEAVARG